MAVDEDKQTETEVKDASTTSVKSEIALLREEIHKLNESMVFKMHRTPMRMIFWQFARGLAVGLGSVIGATILVYLLLQLLQGIDFIPIIGEWAREIIAIVDPNSAITDGANT